MGFVKTPEEIARIEQELSAPRWDGQWLSVQFLTDRDTHRRLLPPPLQPADLPIVGATVGRWHSTCLGDFAGGVVNLAARHGDVEGSYVLALYLDSEPATMFGRDLFGEPKKLASTGFAYEGDQAHGWVERHGVRLLDLRADLGADRGPSSSERWTFNYKARTAAGGHGLEEDAILTHTHFTVSTLVQRPGSGTVTLGSGVHDALTQIEILEVRSAVYAEDQSLARCTPAARVPAQEFLPYHYGRQDDWLALDTLRVRS
jgi:acetoacetate decarboxylase